MRISDWSSDVCSSDLGEWELVASKGDQSTGSRKILLMDMVHQAREMPWWQWVAGMGAGQLNVLWPTREGMVPWGSPHFFWFEMLFYLGIAWPLFMLWLLWRLDWLGRTCLLVIDRKSTRLNSSN